MHRAAWSCWLVSNFRLRGILLLATRESEAPCSGVPCLGQTKPMKIRGAWGVRGNWLAHVGVGQAVAHGVTQGRRCSWALGEAFISILSRDPQKPERTKKNTRQSTIQGSTNQEKHNLRKKKKQNNEINTFCCLCKTRWLNKHMFFFFLIEPPKPTSSFARFGEVNTFFMMLFSGFMSVTFGACLPCLMVAEAHGPGPDCAGSGASDVFGSAGRRGRGKHHFLLAGRGMARIFWVRFRDLRLLHGSQKNLFMAKNDRNFRSRLLVAPPSMALRQHRRFFWDVPSRSPAGHVAVLPACRLAAAAAHGSHDGFRRLAQEYVPPTQNSRFFQGISWKTWFSMVGTSFFWQSGHDTLKNEDIWRLRGYGGEREGEKLGRGVPLF